jgi:hypothetical protein
MDLYDNFQNSPKVSTLNLREFVASSLKEFCPYYVVWDIVWDNEAAANGFYKPGKKYKVIDADEIRNLLIIDEDGEEWWEAPNYFIPVV